MEKILSSGIHSGGTYTNVQVYYIKYRYSKLQQTNLVIIAQSVTAAPRRVPRSFTNCRRAMQFQTEYV